TAGELSDIANVPRSRTYDVLESLEKKGFIIMKIGKPIKYIAVSPTEVLERVKKKVHDEAEKRADVLDKLKGTEILKELNLLHKNGIDLVEPTDLSGFLKGSDNLYHHLEFSIKNAKESVILTTTASGIIKKADKLFNALKQAKEAGVKIKVIAPTNKKNEEAIKKIKTVADFKTTLDFESRSCLVDGKQVILMLSNDENIHESYDTGVWINSDFFCQSYARMLDMTWKNLK
ncbi:MAG: helix-turn-helix domain-containing protein, partial [Candidatus Woesearchaeota archaeon]|nr:helix-turn-helix domain-containing protein [Candidatus Woesearchaeota archaeon]